MRHLILSAAIAALLPLAAPAQAMPSAISAVFDGLMVPVRDGCGPFGHRSHYGYCKDDLHPGLTYQPGEYRGGGYGDGRYDDGFGRGPRFYDEDGYRERRCFIRETYDGPVRICR